MKRVGTVFFFFLNKVKESKLNWPDSRTSVRVGSVNDGDGAKGRTEENDRTKSESIFETRKIRKES